MSGEGALSRTLLFENLDIRISLETMKLQFSLYGTIKKINIQTDFMSNYANITFSNRAEAAQARMHLDQTTWYGKKLKVTYNEEGNGRIENAPYLR
jgi:RNA recognition motif-containing protein